MDKFSGADSAPLKVGVNPFRRSLAFFLERVAQDSNHLGELVHFVHEWSLGALSLLMVLGVCVESLAWDTASY